MNVASTDLFAFQNLRLAVVMGTNEIASAVAIALSRAGYGVVMSHDPFPPVIRRGMAFHDALYDDLVEINGFRGQRADGLVEIVGVLARRRHIAVTPLSMTDLLALRVADVLVDARMQKKRLTPDFRRLAKTTIGIGPKFEVGVNCDIAIESLPAEAGQVVLAGGTKEADGAAPLLGGVGRERFVYADRDGVWTTNVDVGVWVPKNFVLGRHGGRSVAAPMDGFLRGVARDGAFVPHEAKIVEIDPRNRNACWAGVDERGARLAAACVKAVKTVKPLRRRPLGRTSELEAGR